MDIFAAFIWSAELDYAEHCRACLYAIYGHFWGDLFSGISLLRKNGEDKLIHSIPLGRNELRCEKNGLRGF